jgi:flagellar protein FlaG
MSNITQLTAVPADLIGAPVTPPAQATPPSAATPPPPPAASSGSAPANESSQRLVISEGAQTGVYVYTILDRTTGEVLVQIPREEVVRISSRPGYSAGQVINTKV